MYLPAAYDLEDTGRNGLRYLTASIIFLGLAAIGFVAYDMSLVGGIILLLALAPFAIYSLVKCPDVLVFIALMVNYTPVPHNYGNLIIIATALALILGRALSGQAWLKLDSVVILWLVMAGLAFLTIPKWHSLSLGVKGLHRAFILPLSIYILFTQRYISDSGIRRFIKIYVPILAAYVLGQVALIFFVSNVNVASHWQAVHAGFDLGWGKSNTIAATLVLFAVLLYSNPLIKVGTFMQRLLLYTIICTSLIFTAVIVSRGAILSLLVATLIYSSIVVYRSKRISISKLIGYGTALAVLGLVLLRKPLLDYIDRFSSLKVDVSTFARLYMIRDTLLTIKNNLLIGVGPNQKMYSDFYMYHENPHNVMLQYGTEMGLLAVVIMAVLFVLPYVRGWRRLRAEPAKSQHLLGLFFLPLTVSIINSQGEAAITLYHYGVVFWIYYSIGMRMIHDLEANDSSLLRRLF